MAELEKLRSPEKLEYLCLIPAIKSARNNLAETGLLWEFCCQLIPAIEGNSGRRAIRLMLALAYFGTEHWYLEVENILEDPFAHGRGLNYLASRNDSEDASDDEYPTIVENWMPFSILVEYGLIMKSRNGFYHLSSLLMLAIRQCNQSENQEIESLRFALQILDNSPVRSEDCHDWIWFTQSVWSFALKHDVLLQEFRSFAYAFYTGTTGRFRDREYIKGLRFVEIAQKFRDLFKPLGIESLPLLGLELKEMMLDFYNRNKISYPHGIETVLARAQEFVQIYKSAQNTNTLPRGLVSGTKNIFGKFGRYIYQSAFAASIPTEIMQKELIIQAYELCKSCFSGCKEKTNLLGSNHEEICRPY